MAYCIWFCVVLAISFTKISQAVLAGRFIDWIVPKWSSNPFIRMAAAGSVWLGFVLLMSWLPLFLLRTRGGNVLRLIAKTGAFFTSLLLCTILCTILWETCVNDFLYNCTDPGFLDYLSPGDWVHGRVESVPVIVTGRSMSEPDTIKAGWSVTGLWCLWLTFVAASVAISAMVARLLWRSRPSTDSPGEPHK